MDNKRIERFELIFLLFLFLIPFTVAGYYLFQRALPWWTDPGEWLMYAHGIKGSILSALGALSDTQREELLGPMLNINPWQYPPLFPLLQILLSSIIDEITSIKILAVILFALQPIPMYYIARKITGSRVAAAFAGIASSVSPIHAEMLGWGGYPNLLAITLMPFAFLSMINYVESGSKRFFTLSFLFGSLTILAHHLTTIILIGVPIAWIAFTYLVKRYPRYTLQEGREEKNFDTLRVVKVVISWASVFLAYRIAVWPPQYDPDNVAAFYKLRFDPVTMIPWVFKGLLPLVAILLISILGFLELRKHFEIRYLTFIEAWSFIPIVSTQAYLAGIFIDYNRMFIYTVQPVYILISLPIAAVYMLREPIIGMKSICEWMRDTIGVRLDPKKFGAAMMALLTVTASLSTFWLGLATMNNVNLWYNGIDQYGDREKVQALSWINNNTNLNSTFVADENLGRWIEGYAMRPVYIFDKPQYLFLEGQLQRQKVAEAILLGNNIIENCFIRVYDQAPYGQYAPIIKIRSQGDFSDLLYLDEGKSNITYGSKILSIFNNALIANLVVVHGGKGYTLSYNLGNVSITKSLSINSGSLKISYLMQGSAESLRELKLMLKALDSDGYVLGVENLASYVSIDTLDGFTKIYSNGDATLYGDRGIIYSFRANGGRINGTLMLSFEAPSVRNCDGRVVSAWDLMKENGISYIAIPRLKDSPAPLTLEQYQHLLNNKQLALVYMNQRVIILSDSTGR